jgi:hypothetical protein
MKPRKPPVGQETSVFTQVMLPDLGGLGLDLEMTYVFVYTGAYILHRYIDI